MKTCNVCKTSKPLDEFHRASNTPDGRQYRCKPCAIAAARQRAVDNPEAAKAADLKYRQSEKYKATRKARRNGPAGEVIREQKRESWKRNHELNLEKLRRRSSSPEYIARARVRYWKTRERDPRGVQRKNLMNNYGLTVDQWDRMLVRQGGRCAICLEPTYDLCVDHCHDSGKVRALLCAQCNRGLGMFADEPARLRAAAKYLIKHQKISAPQQRSVQLDFGITEMMQSAD